MEFLPKSAGGIKAPHFVMFVIDYLQLLEKVRQGYPRMAYIPGPGFAAGPCLMKDTMQLFAFGRHNFPLGQLAMTINEGLPNFLVDQLRRKRKLKGAKVGILGMAFKAESDDTRASLSFKLRKLLIWAGARVRSKAGCRTCWRR